MACRYFYALLCSRLLQVGLVEQEWLDTLANINPEEVTFIDFVEAGRKLGAQLKQEVSCEV
jgi:5'-nucleotidase